MANEFIAHFDGEERKGVYVKYPWDAECSITDELINTDTDCIWRDGRVVHIHCDNGEAQYEIIPQSDDDIDYGLIRLVLLKSTYSPPPIQ